MNFAHALARLGLAASLISLAACSGGGGDSSTEPTPVARAAGMFSQASSTAELESTLKAGLKSGYSSQSVGAHLSTRNIIFSATAETDAGGLQSDGANANGGTYTLESDVDEADIVKYDGDILYTTRRGRYNYCADTNIPADPAVDSVGACTENAGDSIRIFRTEADSAPAELLSEIPLEQAYSIQGVYVPESGQLVVIEGRNNYYGFESALSWFGPWYWLNGSIDIHFYDTSNPSDPQLQRSVSIDGHLTGSRRIGDQLYLVSRFTPNIPSIPYTHYVTEDDLPAVEASIDETALSSLLPKVRENDSEADLFAATDCYVPTEEGDAEPAATITTISSFDLNNGALNSSCYTGDALGMYMSSSALYLATHKYSVSDEGNHQEETLIHKFALQSGEADYRGSGTAPGSLGHGTEVDFQMSEHNDDLRVVTSEYDYSFPVVDLTAQADEPFDSIDHHVTVMRESTTAVELETIGQLPNSSRPAEIGKPNERLYGVRFFGDRAYLVTFEQIDPLYVIDLSTPTDPQIAGELEVPGVADFLHPVNENLLLSLGRIDTEVDSGGNTFRLLRGIKLELFNTSDLSQPSSVQTIELGGKFSSTEARYSRHAFNYQSNFDGNGNDRFSIPADIYQPNEAQFRLDWVESGLFTFELRNTANAANSSMEQVGSLLNDQASDERSYPNTTNERRSRYNGDIVHFIDNGDVYSAEWNTNSAITTND